MSKIVNEPQSVMWIQWVTVYTVYIFLSDIFLSCSGLSFLEWQEGIAHMDTQF